MQKRLHILEKINQDADLTSAWHKLSKEKQQFIMEIDQGRRVPHLLGDTIFKGIFDPDINGDELSRYYPGTE